jgi:hypothetical protein
LTANQAERSVKSGNAFHRGAMTGIQYITDEEGRKVAVQIDLREHAALWEEFEDALISESRRNEESIPIEDVEARLREKSKLGA